MYSGRLALAAMQARRARVLPSRAMSLRAHALVLAFAAVALPAASGRAEEAPPRAEIVSLRFAWPAPARARVVYRRTRAGTGRPPQTFTARYDLVVDRAREALQLSTRRTTWRGDLPVPAALAKEAIRASEAVGQRVGADGEFLGLDGAEALRPVLAHALEVAKVPPEQAERALEVALGAARGEAEELWNLAVGFWTGADLRMAETYAMQSEADLPLVPGVRAAHAMEFRVRRRVPCTAGERAARCVEAVLRSAPDRAVVERSAAALLARVLPPGAAPRGGASKDLAVESELVLVTDPATLLPRRVVWTKAVRVAAGDEGPPEAEHVDRAEYDYRWLPPDPAPRRRTNAPTAAAREESPAAGPVPRLDG
jgi:hypothetical protein